RSGATSMIDSSDGLSRSLNEICAASGTGAVIYQKDLPAAKGASLPEVLHGGEDYELVFTCPGNKADEIIRKLKRLAKAAVIGMATKSKNKMTIVGLDGKERKLETQGFEHFKSDQ
ncbi:MAG: AIR synthase-related protein, partial [Candidatus Margulisiibacteriota bacterium]